MIFGIINIPLKKIVFLLFLMSTLHYNNVQANPFKDLKKRLKSQNQANPTQPQPSNDRSAANATVLSAANQENVEDGDDDFIKIGSDSWVETALAHINNPMIKKETAKNAAIMDAFYKQYPNLPINYTHKSYFLKNIQDKKYDLIDQIDIKETMSAGSTMGQPDPSKDQYSYRVKIKFKHKNLPINSVLLIADDSRSIYSSSAEPVWDANLGMQMPKDINQARARAIHVALESYYLTPVPTNIDYSLLIEKVDVIQEKIEYGFPISKVLVTFKKKPNLNIEKMQNDALPGYAEVINSKKDFYQEKVRYLEQSAKIIGLNFDLANLEKIKKEGSTFGNTGIETQLLATEYENETESGIAKAIKDGALSDAKKKEFDVVNQQRLNNAQTLRLKGQKAAELINLGGRSKQGLNAMAIPFIALSVTLRANAIASKEESLVKKLNAQLNQKPSSANVTVDQNSKQKLEDSLGQ